MLGHGGRLAAYTLASDVLARPANGKITLILFLACCSDNIRLMVCIKRVWYNLVQNFYAFYNNTMCFILFRKNFYVNSLQSATTIEQSLIYLQNTVKELQRLLKDHFGQRF